MNAEKKALVITTIASSKNTILKKYANISSRNEIDFIIVGDKKSPSKFSLKGSRYFSLKKQKTLNFKLSKILPTNHYSRKNLGYLIAMTKNQRLLLKLMTTIFL